jgi:hypothetical protein
MYLKPEHLHRGAASAMIGVQVAVAFLPGFSQALTNTKRQLHHAVTLCAVSLLTVIHFSPARPALRIALCFLLVPSLCAEHLFIATKTFCRCSTSVSVLCR